VVAASDVESITAVECTGAGDVPGAVIADVLVSGSPSSSEAGADVSAPASVGHKQGASVAATEEEADEVAIGDKPEVDVDRSEDVDDVVGSGLVVDDEMVASTVVVDDEVMGTTLVVDDVVGATLVVDDVVGGTLVVDEDVAGCTVLVVDDEVVGAAVLVDDEVAIGKDKLEVDVDRSEDVDDVVGSGLVVDDEVVASTAVVDDDVVGATVVVDDDVEDATLVVEDVVGATLVVDDVAGCDDVVDEVVGSTVVVDDEVAMKDKLEVDVDRSEDDDEVAIGLEVEVEGSEDVEDENPDDDSVFVLANELLVEMLVVEMNAVVVAGADVTSTGCVEVGELSGVASVKATDVAVLSALDSVW
jgi:hypothetical protein